MCWMFVFVVTFVLGHVIYMYLSHDADQFELVQKVETENFVLEALRVGNGFK